MNQSKIHCDLIRSQFYIDTSGKKKVNNKSFSPNLRYGKSKKEPEVEKLTAQDTSTLSMNN